MKASDSKALKLIELGPRLELALVMLVDASAECNLAIKEHQGNF